MNNDVDNDDNYGNDNDDSMNLVGVLDGRPVGRLMIDDDDNYDCDEMNNDAHNDDNYGMVIIMVW